MFDPLPRFLLKTQLLVQWAEESGGDESWYSLQQTCALATAMSYEEILRAVATVAWEYPYFTWDEAGALIHCSFWLCSFCLKGKRWMQLSK